MIENKQITQPMSMQELQDHLRSQDIEKIGECAFRSTVPRIECADGFSLSVQANDTAYCMPRNLEGPYTKVEVGFPSESVPALMPYMDGSDADPTDTVYAYVPIEIVLDVINGHVLQEEEAS